jgi:hypothetical protein
MEGTNRTEQLGGIQKIENRQKLGTRGLLELLFEQDFGPTRNLLFTESLRAIILSVRSGEISPSINSSLAICHNLLSQNFFGVGMEDGFEKCLTHSGINELLRQGNVPMVLEILKAGLYAHLSYFHVNYINKAALPYANNDPEKLPEIKQNTAQNISDILVLRGREDIDLAEVEIEE